jgi:hypothetical protein
MNGSVVGKCEGNTAAIIGDRSNCTGYKAIGSTYPVISR